PREGEARVTLDRQLLAAHVGGAYGRLGPRGLPEVDDPRVARRGAERPRERLAPERVDADGEALVTEGAADAVELDDLVRTELACPLEASEVASGGDDLRRSEQPGGLDGDEPDHATRAEHEHAIFRRHLRLPCDRDPAGEPGDPGAGGERRLDPVRQTQLQLARHGDPLGEKPRLRHAAAFAEEVDERPFLGAPG